MLAYTLLDERAFYFHGFLKYLAKNSATLFSDYEVALAEYHWKVTGGTDFHLHCLGSVEHTSALIRLVCLLCFENINV